MRFALVLVALRLAHGRTVVTFPPEYAGESFLTPALGFARGSLTPPPDRPVLPFDLSWCDACGGGADGLDLNGAVLFHSLSYEPCFRCGYAAIAIMARRANASAALWRASMDAGHEVYVIHSGADWDDARGFPFFEIGAADNDALASIARAGAVRVTVEESANPWVAFYGSWWIGVQAVCGGSSVAVLVYGVRRLAHFVRRKGQFQVAIAVLSIEAVNNSIRILYAIDPLWTREIFSYGVGRMLLTVSIPIGLMSAVLLFLAWSDMLGATKGSGGAGLFKSRRSQVVFAVVGLVFIGGDLALGVMAAVNGWVDLSLLAALIDSVFSLLVGIGIGVVGTRLLRTLSAGSSRATDKVSRLTRKIRRMGVFLVLAALVIALAGQEPIMFRLVPRAAVFTMYYITQSARSFYTITFFERGSAKRTSPYSTAVSTAAAL